MNKQEALEALKENSWEFETNYFKYELVIDLKDAQEIVSQIDEPQKPVVPKFVAEWVGYCKFNRLTLLGAFDPVSELGVGLVTSLTEELRKGKYWAQRNQETFARAWLDGYKIEREKLYTVEIAEAILTKITRGRNVQYKMLPSRDVSEVFDNAIYYITRLTEKEIKEADERLWQFAKEVEEDK